MISKKLLQTINILQNIANLKKIYNKLIRNINYSQKIAELYINKKRKKKSQFKEKNKVYHLRKYLRDLRPNKKLNHKKIGLFIIKKKKSKINYELDLLKDIKIYFVFHVSSLKLADSKILLITKKLLELA